MSVTSLSYHTYEDLIGEIYNTTNAKNADIDDISNGLAIKLITKIKSQIDSVFTSLLNDVANDERIQLKLEALSNSINHLWRWSNDHGINVIDRYNQLKTTHETVLLEQQISDAKIKDLETHFKQIEDELTLTKQALSDSQKYSFSFFFFF